MFVLNVEISVINVLIACWAVVHNVMDHRTSMMVEIVRIVIRAVRSVDYN